MKIMQRVQFHVKEERKKNVICICVPLLKEKCTLMNPSEPQGVFLHGATQQSVSCIHTLRHTGGWKKRQNKTSADGMQANKQRVLTSTNNYCVKTTDYK